MHIENLSLSYDDYDWIHKNINFNHKVIYGSNYIKHKNFVIVSKIDKKIFKIYNTKNMCNLAKLKYELAYNLFNKKYIIPKIIDYKVIDNKFLLELEYIEHIQIKNIDDGINIFKSIIDKIQNYSSSEPFLSDFELKNEYEKIFVPNKKILTHGDLNFVNIRETLDNNIILFDWDNFSYQDEKLVETTTCFLYLSHPLINIKNGYDKCKIVFPNINLEDLIKIADGKYNLSVSQTTKNYWNDMKTKLQSLKNA